MTLEQAQALATQGKLRAWRNEPTSSGNRGIVLKHYVLNGWERVCRLPDAPSQDKCTADVNAVLLAKYWNQFNELLAFAQMIASSEEVKSSHRESKKGNENNASVLLTPYGVENLYALVAKARHVPELCQSWTRQLARHKKGPKHEPHATA